MRDIRKDSVELLTKDCFEVSSDLVPHLTIRLVVCTAWSKQGQHRIYHETVSTGSVCEECYLQSS